VVGAGAPAAGPEKSGAPGAQPADGATPARPAPGETKKNKKTTDRPAADSEESP